MTNFPFDDTIPATGNDPSVDQPTMLTNNVSSQGIMNVDHIGYNFNNGGIHRQVNMFNESSPTRIGDSVTYSNLDNGTTSLWFKNSLSDLPLFSGTPSAGVA